jgi:hypothetical protein
MAEIVVEHNDIDISPLFSWSKEFEVTANETVTPVYMRLLGDADMNRARVAALRKSAELRKKLKDLNSDERLAFIKDIDDIELESLIAVVTVFSMRDLSTKAQAKLKIKAPKVPRSDAKTSVHEKYQAELDSYPERRQAELRELLNKEVELMKESLTKLGKEEVYKKYIASMIDEMCEQELLREFKSQCCYFGCYKTKELTERLFSSYDEFANLQSNLKEQFLEEYSSMELQGEDLKKLQRVTQ